MKGHKEGSLRRVFPDDHNLVLLGHELGNVLNGLLGMAELLGDCGLNAEQDRWLRAIEHAGKQMQALIRTVDFSAGEGGLNIVPRTRRTNGMELLEQVVTSHTPAARSRNNRLLLVVDPGLPRHWNCDPCLVRQLLDNLVGNAIKFTGSGEVVLEVASEPLTGATGTTLGFRISDTGCGLGGIAENHIFGAYQRSSPSSGEESGGRGLGLFICRNIVLSMNGSIAGSSPKGGGACFEIALPEALIFRETSPAVSRSSLLAQIRCRLQLRNPLRHSVENFLARMGVRWSNHESTASQTSGRGLTIVISDAGRASENHPPGLLLTPQPRQSAGRNNWILDAPVLESGLGVLLLEIALQWRGLKVRNETPGSTPSQR